MYVDEKAVRQIIDQDSVLLKKREHWGGEYRGVSFDIVRWPMDEYTSVWNYYIFVNENMFAKKDRKDWIPQRAEKSKRMVYGFDYNKSKLAQLEWHGGITFGEVSINLKGHKVSKVGCDYNHSWDQGISYSLGSIYHDAKRTIDSLYELYPKLRNFDFQDGKYKSPEVIKELRKKCQEERGKEKANV